MRSPLRSPAQVEGPQGVLPQPEKDLERPSSTRLEARFPNCREPAYCILSAYCILHIKTEGDVELMTSLDGLSLLLVSWLGLGELDFSNLFYSHGNKFKKLTTHFYQHHCKD